jgi:hypothetical protein
MLKVQCDGPQCASSTTPEDAHQRWWVLARGDDVSGQNRRWEFCKTECVVNFIKDREKQTRKSVTVRANP